MSDKSKTPKRRFRGKRRLKSNPERGRSHSLNAGTFERVTGRPITYPRLSPPDSSSTMLEWAVFYIVVLGWALVPVAPREKRPLGKGWNRPRSVDNPEGYVTSVEDAEEVWGQNPEYGIGLVLGPSGIGSLDIDNLDLAREAFERVGIDIDELLESGVRIQGGEGRAKILYRVPDGIDLTTRKFSKPDPENPDAKSIMVFDLRTGLLQDVLPPSIHPGTGKPYEWLSPPWRKGGIDELS